MADTRGHSAGYINFFGPRENPDEDGWSQLIEKARREKEDLWERLKRESIREEPTVEKDVWLERLRREAAIRAGPVVFKGNVGSYNPEERASKNEIIARGMAASRYSSAYRSLFGPRENEKQQPDEEIWSQLREEARREKDGLWERLKRESIGKEPMVFKGNVGSCIPQLDGYTNPEERARDYAKYVSQINASGGFDVDSFPKFQGFLDMITPVNDVDLKSLANVAAIAIEKFNSNHQGANYQVDEVVKATQRFCQGMVYNITFTAKEEGGAESITFIASVYCAIPNSHREVQFCDIKKPEHESEAKKLLNQIVI